MTRPWPTVSARPTSIPVATCGASPTASIVDGRPWRHQPLHHVGAHAVANQEMLVGHDRLAAAQAYVRENRLDRVVGCPDPAGLGVVCAGKTYFDVLQAFADLGVSVDGLAKHGVRLLKLAMTYPLVEETVVEFAASVDEIVVIEEKRPFVETQLRSILHEHGSTVAVSGKRDPSGRPLVSVVGELDPAQAVARPSPGACPRSRRRPRPVGAGRWLVAGRAAAPAARRSAAGARTTAPPSSPTAPSSAAGWAATGSCTSRRVIRA